MRWVFRLTKTTVLAVLLVGTVALNVATVAVGSVAALVSGVVEAVTGVTSVNTRMETKVRAQEAELKGARAEVDVKTRQVQRLEGEVGKLRAERQVSYRGQRKLASEAVEDTSQRVARRTATGASRNVAATFGEAVPVVGIGVVVAATVWELHDACETMKDLQALDLAFNPDKANPPEVAEVCGLTVPSKEEIWEKVKASPGEAWRMAKEAMPDLPEMPKPDWTFWN